MVGKTLAESQRTLTGSHKLKFGSLFLALILVLAVPPLLPRGTVLSVGIQVFYTLIFLSGLATVSEERSTFRIGLALVVPAIVLNWAAVWVESLALDVIGDALIVIFLVHLGYNLLRHVLGARQVDAEMIYGVLCVYLMLGLIWGVGYQVLDKVQPGSFHVPDQMVAAESGVANPDRSVLLYFSYVTITTLGYGDVTPVNDVARSLSMLEALLGQLFLVVLVARLVGMYTAAQSAELPREDREDGG
jgi:hypothetical protein